MSEPRQFCDHGISALQQRLADVQENESMQAALVNELQSKLAEAERRTEDWHAVADCRAEEIIRLQQQLAEAKSVRQTVEHQNAELNEMLTVGSKEQARTIQQLSELRERFGKLDTARAEERAECVRLLRQRAKELKNIGARTWEWVNDDADWLEGQPK